MALTKITKAMMADESIDSDSYVDGSIDNAHIADDAIDSEHYADGSIDNAHIADDAIDSEHYADGSIDNAHIADDAIDSEHYAAGSIDEAHIADNAVTLAKMAGGTDGNIISFDSSGDPVAIATGNDGQVLTSAGSGAQPAFEDAAGGGKVLQITKATYTSETSSSNTYPHDDTPPLYSEGAELVSGTITPTSSGSIILVRVTGSMCTVSHSIIALYRNTVATPLRVAANQGHASYLENFAIAHIDSPSTTSSTTYSVRYGCNTGTSYANNASDGNYWGGTLGWDLTMIEYTP